MKTHDPFTSMKQKAEADLRKFAPKHTEQGGPTMNTTHAVKVIVDAMDNLGYFKAHLDQHKGNLSPGHEAARQTFAVTLLHVAGLYAESQERTPSEALAHEEEALAYVEQELAGLMRIRTKVRARLLPESPSALAEWCNTQVDECNQEIKRASVRIMALKALVEANSLRCTTASYSNHVTPGTFFRLAPGSRSIVSSGWASRMP